LRAALIALGAALLGAAYLTTLFPSPLAERIRQRAAEIATDTKTAIEFTSSSHR